MKRKISALAIATLFMAGINATAQDVNNENSIEVSQGRSIEDIINEQQELTKNSTWEKHMEKVWSRKNYFNINYGSASMSPKGDYSTGIPDQYAPQFKTSWGVALTAGHNYNLLKKPVANIFQVNIDYNPLELTVNCYDAVNDGFYNSGASNSEGKKYIPWNLAKYQFSYGMSVGPSVTLAPFVSLNGEGLHFLKLNLYYHIGYQVSLMYMPTDKEKDLNQTSLSKNMDIVNLEFGHGLISAFGLSLSWKAIGLGYEYTYTPYTYIALDKDRFGKDKYKFGNSGNRVYIQLRF